MKKYQFNYHLWFSFVTRENTKYTILPERFSELNIVYNIIDTQDH